MLHSRIVPAFVCVALVHAALIAAFVAPHDDQAPRQLRSHAIVARLLSPQSEATPGSTGLASPPHAPPQRMPPPSRAVAQRSLPEQPIAATRTRPIAAASHPAPVSRVPSPPDQTTQTATQATASADKPAPRPDSSTANSAPAAAPVPRDTIALAAPKPVDHADCRIAKPTYPELSKRRGEAGTATIRFVIDATGAIGNIALIKSSGFARLDDAAVQALRESACRPYVENGSPIRVAFVQAFTFGLDDE
ncbi:energy transducer TonB [Trinickia soli]|uniref:energy transducer TonB n=1 Tax=Trinickia soli TaxID=380675 RepID=UPI003FA354BE